MMTGMLAATLGAMTPVFAQTTEPSPYSSYLFAFFSNNSPYGEQVRYALSDDGYNYTSLNQGRPVVASDTIARCDYTVMIPMSHAVDSLNVAAASAVAFYQLGLMSCPE